MPPVTENTIGKEIDKWDYGDLFTKQVLLIDTLTIWMYRKNYKEHNMKKFLTAFAGIAAAFAASAAAVPSTAQFMAPTLDVLSISAPQANVFSKNASSAASIDDQFNFVLKKSADTGLVMARHASHASHRSHSSHYSSR